MNLDHLLLALHDGARKAEQVGETGLAAVLHTMTDSLAESSRNQKGLYGWRSDEVREIFRAGSAGA